MKSSYSVVNGRILSPQLEINVAEHCNLACRSCSHLSPVMPKRELDPESLQRDLLRLTRHYHVDTVKLLGGEPLLHRNLLGIVDVVRQAKIADRVTVITNGVLLTRMSGAFWAAIDAVHVSLYPGVKLGHEAIGNWEEMAAEHETELRIQPTGQFQETYSEIGTKDARLVTRIYRACDLVQTWRCHTIADGYFWKCPQSYFLARLLPSRESELGYADAVKLDDDPDLCARLLGYLESDEPLEACSNCLGTAGRRFRHTQVPRGQFRAAQAQPTEELIDYRKLAPRSWRRVRARLEKGVEAALPAASPGSTG